MTLFITASPGGRCHARLINNADAGNVICTTIATGSGNSNTQAVAKGTSIATVAQDAIYRLEQYTNVFSGGACRLGKSFDNNNGIMSQINIIKIR